MGKILFKTQEVQVVPIVGTDDLYPVNRIFCVGRNYADHAKEMGVEVDREEPFYFTKPSSAIVHTSAKIPYPLETKNYHYEMELVFAISKPAFRVHIDDAFDYVFGFAAGLDMTRRDLQQVAKTKKHPWDLAKAFEQSAIIAPITRKEDFADIGPQRITLSVNGDMKQNAHLFDLVWSIPELISHLSRFYHLMPGDLIYTGTPAGVGPLVPGDKVLGKIDGLTPIELTIGKPE